MNVGLIDGPGWSETLADLNVFQDELPRILIAVDDFSHHYEDRDHITVGDLTEWAKRWESLKDSSERKSFVDEIQSKWKVVAQSRSFMTRMMLIGRRFYRAWAGMFG
jgi:hypothetical protein